MNWTRFGTVLRWSKTNTLVACSAATVAVVAKLVGATWLAGYFFSLTAVALLSMTGLVLWFSVTETLLVE